MTPDARHLPASGIDMVPGAVLMPMTPDTGMACGALGPDGAPLPAARTLLSGNRFTPDPEMPKDAPAHLPGRWLFAGVGRHHFGHFLLEAIPRLWALDHIAQPVDGIALIPMYGRDIAAVLRRRLGPLLALLGQNLPVHLIDRPTRVDMLVLPSQGFGHLHWSHGTPEARAYMRRLLCTDAPPGGPDKIYISRRRLKSPAQQVPHEKQIERWMSQAGYAVLHPERLTIADQIDHYRAATTIVGPDGSAFHFAPFVMPRGARVGLIQRRTRQATFDAIARQIEGFADADLITTSAIARLDNAPQDLDSDSAIPPELRQLRADLKAAGFI
ncbi:glycosyltransferase 61 family protein [uncultured Roseovarius sp.]|uniref:glycosyltransferase family 61 protein n=1 Tax=uncultured Roseovarius sp. TaxID=293344 RepID=UPI00262872F3|nr:glycosyltransferase 61 family protein [uncultured Roseovarius sp.]